jgi:transposase
MDEASEELSEVLLERVAAIDIAKASGMVCLRLPHDTREGRRVQQVWTVGATTNAILELGDKLVCQGVQRVVMEATSSYWKPFFFLLEARGLECWLVNARQVKNVPGRPKTDKLDAVWLCKLAERGMMTPSFVPPAPVRRLRDLTRTRAVFIQDRTRHKQRAEKLLEDAQIKLTSVISDAFGVSGRAMLDALIAGRRDARELAQLARGSMKAKHDTLVEALTGNFTDHHGYLLKVFLDAIDHLTAQIADLEREIEAAIADLPVPDPGGGGGRPATGPDIVERLDAIPGVGPRCAQVILAELGPDMTAFPTADHLASWAKLSPRTVQSGARNRGGRTGKGNPWLKGALGEAAMAASRTDT